jgi:hypothetical protein
VMRDNPDILRQLIDEKIEEMKRKGELWFYCINPLTQAMWDAELFFWKKYNPSLKFVSKSSGIAHTFICARIKLTKIWLSSKILRNNGFTEFYEAGISISNSIIGKSAISFHCRIFMRYIP